MAAPTARRGKVHTVLIVDDEPRILDSVRMNLELEGYQVFEATNGQEALDAVRLRLPDLVVMDVMMPQMDGFEALRELRKFSSVPGGLLTITMHPECIGRGHRMAMLERFIDAASALDGVVFDRLDRYVERWLRN